MGKVNIEENFSLQRIHERCIDCGACLQTCTSLHSLKEEDCVHCGQCILNCPMGALQPKYNYKEVFANLHDEEKIVVVSVAPAVRVAIGDAFGYAPGEFLEETLVGALKTLGFSYVFDVTFGADLTVMEEARELVNRLQENKNLPLFTSCCPSWVLFMENYHLEDIDHLSTCKSPIGMQGAIIKSYFAEMKHLNPQDIVTVTIAPCVSKKTEIQKEKERDNDYVLTTSELILLLREQSMDLKEIEPQKFDSILGRGSGSGLLFGTSGGVTEAVLRTAYYFLNGKKAPENFFHFPSLREKTSFKEAVVDLGVVTIRVAVVFGFHRVKQMYEELKHYHFVEVMACPNGCVGGGGQPVLTKQQQELYVNARRKSLYEKEKDYLKKCSYENEEIETIYKEFLKEPFSEQAKKYLHSSRNCIKMKDSCGR